MGNKVYKPKEPLTLKMLKHFKGLFDKMGVDYDLLYKILQVKFLMDGRKTSTVFNTVEQKKDKKAFNYAVFMNLFIGFFLALLAVMPGMPVFYMMSGLFGTIMFYLGLYMLADYSTVILDVRDRIIIGTRPVTNKTLNVAKIVHISSYLIRTVFFIVILPLIVVLIRFGLLFFLVFIGEIMLMTIMIMFFTSIIYYVLLSLLDGEKLKDIINYIQVAFSIVIVVAQQIVPRMFTFIEGQITYSFKNWFYFLPPMWMASPFELLDKGMMHKGYIVMTSLSVGVPIILLIVYIKYMAPYFEAKLMKLNSGNDVKHIRPKSNQTLMRRIGDKICKEPVEKAAYNFVIHMTRTERKFKLQLYPQLALYTIMPWICIVAFIHEDDKAQTFLEQIRGGRAYFLLYLGLIIGSFALGLITKSENYQAAWIYKVSPTASPAPLLKGTFKAIMVKYNIPFTIIQCVIFTLVYGVEIIPIIIVMVINSILFMLLGYKYTKKQMPFSSDYSVKDVSQGSIGMIIIFVMVGIGLIHFGLSYVPYGNMILGMVSIVSIVLLGRGLFKITWEEVKVE